jgi:hypothetical protein
VRQHERDSGQRKGVTTADADRIKDLASAFSAQTELDRRLK